MIRKVIFRLHLSVAAVVGGVVLLMALTGVVLACEDLVMEVAQRRYRVTVPVDAPRLPPAGLVGAVEGSDVAGGDPFVATSLEYRHGPRAAVQVHAGRDRRVFVDPYTGEVLGEGFAGLEAFFEGVRSWHRWLNVPDAAVRKGRAVTGAANLALLFLLLTGPLLWIPRRITRRTLAEGLFFRRGIRGPARDLNWHYVIGIWSVVPLMMISATGVVLSYPAAGERVFPVVGGVMPLGSLPAREVPGGGGGGGLGADSATALAAAFAAAESLVPGWRSIVLTVPRPAERAVRAEVRAGRIGQPQKAGVVTVDRRTGAPSSWEPFSEGTPSSRAQQFLRFAHTGEYWGLAGQGVVGLFALGAAMMVWTGLSVALVTLRLWRQKRSG